MKANDYAYPGNELELFAGAVHWKRYFASMIKPHISGNILEAGAGNGANTPYLMNDLVESWTLLEPDGSMCATIHQLINAKTLPSSCNCVHGTITSIPEMPRFDCILYIDVLEHIENDRQELIEAKKRLKPGGRLIILAPAHQKLMSPFDKAIGHFRRYSRRSLQDIIPGGMAQVRTLYADSLGLLASIVNRWILRQTMPRKEQIRFWDDRLIPGSRVTDKILLHLAGRSIIGIWKKTLL